MARVKITRRAGNQGLLYLRVSSPSQVETDFDPEGLSLPAQRRKCHERARELGLELVDPEFIDPGISGMSIEKRKSYQQLMERVRTDDSISFVMVYATSRLNRDYEEASYFNLMVRSYGVRLVSATQDIDDDDPNGRMMRGLLAVIDDYQSRSNGQDISYKLTQKALVGGTPGYVPPGYVNVREDFEGRQVNSVAVDPVRGDLIAQAFEWFATGQFTYAELSAKMAEVGLLSRPNRRQPSRPLSTSAVERMLRNRYYLGYVILNGTEYEGRHQALVSQELFDRVQSALEVMPGAGNRQRRYHHYLKGLVWCQRCKRRLIVMRGKSKTGELYFYYVCRGRQDRLCNLPYIRVAQVEAAGAAHYQTIAVTGAFRKKLADVFDAAVKEHLDNDTAERARLRRRLTELDRQEDRYIELALDPDWPRQKLSAKLRAIRDERTRLQSSLDTTADQLKAGLANARRILDYLDRPYELYADASIRNRERLNRLFFNKLHIDVEATGARITTDAVAEPFETVIYLRRAWGDRALEPFIKTGGASDWDGGFRHELAGLLACVSSVNSSESSSKSSLAEVIRAYSNFLVPAIRVG